MRFATFVTAAVIAVAPFAAHAADVTPLVSADWVKTHSADDNVVLLDIRGDIENTELGDLPYVANAVVAPYATAGWRTEIDGVPGQIPAPEQIAELIGGLGIDSDDHVVIIPWGTDSSEFGGATRIYWTFKYLGHDAVSILDGGWRQYDAAGGERVAEPVTPEAVTFEYEIQPELRASTADVEAALEDGTLLVDGRPHAQYVGESKSPVVRANGTIPGAVNLENGRLYSADYASFAQPETVAALSEEIGLDLAGDQENIVFCNTGHWASVVWFALHEIGGNENTTMYDGSMAEWAADPSRPLQ